MESGENVDHDSSWNKGELLSHSEVIDIVNRLKDTDFESTENVLDDLIAEEKPEGTGVKQLIILSSMIVLLACLFAFFCYHLFNQLKERDTRRQKRRKETKSKLSQRKTK